MTIARPHPVIDPARVVADLRALARFGACGTGVSRPAFSSDDMAARRWLRDRFTDAGLAAEIDGVGTLLGRDPRAGRAVLAGSHSDSVPAGGWLDGALGVIYALEAARAWRDARPDATVGIDVVSFADEEGTHAACLGSQAFCGALDETILQAEPLERAMAGAGLSGRPGHRLDPDRHRAYLEAHIEQGPRLEAAGVDVGIVEGIVGLRRHWVRFDGQADHAGTTPMAMRQDAGRALFGFCVDLDRSFRAAAGPGSVWNIGIVRVEPGAANVVPSRAEVMVEYRDLDPAVIERMTGALTAAAAACGSPPVVTPAGALHPAAMDPGLRADFEAAAATLGATSLTMPSGAGHDAMILARAVPAAMLFVPSIGGRSHDISENTSEADIGRGAAVFAAAAFRVLDGLEDL